jgi:hypothetical protein
MGGALASATASADHSPERESMPHPATQSYARGDRAQRDRACERCHEDVAREQRASLHRASFEDGSFQHGYAIEPTSFCRSCHAPEGHPDDEPDAFARSHGVSCVTCHLPEGSDVVLAAPAGADGRARPGPPHAIERVASFGTRACAACHEFAFPGATHLGAQGLMQATMREHLAAAPAQTCSECHMPRTESGRRAHGFAASRDPPMLARALAVRAERTDEGASFLLTARGVGHAFPTGDLFRRLVLRVRTPRGRVERPFGRTFRSARDEVHGVVRFQASDHRLAPAASAHVELPPGEHATWEVAYQRITAVGQTPPFAVTVEAETILARGAL